MVKTKHPGVTLIKRSALKGKKPAAADPKHAPVDNFVLVDNEDSTCTVYGVDAAGNQVDISGVATLTPPPTSSDPTVIVVDPPVGMTFTMHATGKLSTPGNPVQVTATATWNDGSAGPYVFTLPVDVVAGTAGAIVIVPGPPTVQGP
jgi:hypothetical protein